MSRNDFIEKIKRLAVTYGRENDILPSLISGVACLESNYGQSGLSRGANNLFGIKGTYKGDSVHLPTTEYVNGSPIRTTAQFRKYPSQEDSIQDFCNLLKKGVSWNREIYSKVVQAKDYKSASFEFGSSPYATDIHYKEKLVKVIESNEFQLLDIEPKPIEPKPIEPKIYQLNDSDETIKQFEKYFNLEQDGNFGQVLEAYVKVFQYERGLQVTGKVDAETYNRMKIL